MALEDRARHRKLVLLLHRQSTEQVMGAGRDIALGVALQKHQGPLGIAVEQRRGGGEAQDVGVTRPLQQRLFGERQEPGKPRPSQRRRLQPSGDRSAIQDARNGEKQKTI